MFILTVPDTESAIALKELIEANLNREVATIEENKLWTTGSESRRQLKDLWELCLLNNIPLPEQVSFKCQLPFPRREREADGEPQIWVSCLSAYNNGYLHGLWIDASQDAESIEEDINWMLSWSPMRDFEPCEEWAIHDFEMAGFEISEWQDLETVAKLGEFIAANDEDYIKAFSEFINFRGSFYHNSFEDAIEQFETAYVGVFESKDHFVEDFYRTTLNQLEKFCIGASTADQYIDYEKVINDLECMGYGFVDLGIKVTRHEAIHQIAVFEP